MIDIQLTDHILSVQTCLEQAMSGGAGAVNIFIGTVRNNTQGRQVVRLEYEAYAPMARSEMRKIAEQARQRWTIHGIAIHHRVGVLQVGEAAVIIAVTTPHRAESFAACQWVIDTLKQTVPIWKKEVFEDGEVWVAAHP